MGSTKRVVQVINTATHVVNFLFKTGRILKAIELSKERLILLSLLNNIEMTNSFVPISDHTSAIDNDRLHRQCDEKYKEGRQIFEQGKLYQEKGMHQRSKDLYLKALSIAIEFGHKQGEAACYGSLGDVFQCLGKYVKAEEYLQKALQIQREIGDNHGESACYLSLGHIFLCLGEYVKAEEYLRKALQIKREIGDKHGEAACYGSLGNLFESLGEYVKAEEYLQKALQIKKDIGDKHGEAACYISLGDVFKSLGKYVMAEEFLQKALQIKREIGDKRGESTCYISLGNVFHHLGEYVKAEEYLQKALQIKTEIGDKHGESTCYINLGDVFQHLGEYVKTKEYLQKALQIKREIGDKHGEAPCYITLGIVFQHRGEYVKAKEYLQKALQIKREIGDKHGEAPCYITLGIVFQHLGEYVKAKEYLQKALQIKTEIGDKHGESTCYINLGNVFHHLGEYVKAKEYLQKALQIKTEIGDKHGESTCYINLGSVFQDLGEYVKAKEYLQKALQIKTEIGDKHGESTCYINLGNVFQNLGEYVKAKEYLQKALQIKTEIGDNAGEAKCYRNLGDVWTSLGEYVKAKQYYEKALALSYETGRIDIQLDSHLSIAFFCLTGNKGDAVSNLLASIEKCEKMRFHLRANDQFKISFLDKKAPVYKTLSLLFLMTGKFHEALCVQELGRARALADLLLAQYSVEQQTSVNPRSWFNIKRIETKESNCSCLYISCHHHQLLLWVIKPNKTIHFRLKDVNDHFGNKKESRSVDKIFNDIIFRKSHFQLTQEHCEDRSLFPSNTAYVKQASPSGGDEPSVLRPVEEDGGDESQCVDPPDLSQCYKMIIGPVADLLVDPEIIIVPDSVLCKVPFSAFKDENGKYLSETFRIRIAPSLTTLRLIQESPEDYHSQTGVLIVGEPKIGQVFHKGRREKLCPLPGAREEAEMVARLLGAQPLLGEHATKQAVLQRIHSVGLIHFAAHGDAERGEIALAAPRSFEGIPQEEHYLLTMAEVSQVRLRAKLVVLSCCHSARGQIRSEGVVGIARAFLGSGARSVLVALWAIEDLATKQFMSRFYEHLVRGESASESLHQTMKWMRGNGFAKVRQWAPFMLIGDNVTFDFGK